MGLCNTETRRRRPFKTIIIPRGIIDPNADNVIEIPLNLDANSSLIVKAPNDANSCFSVEPYGGNFKDFPQHYPSQPMSSTFMNNAVQQTMEIHAQPRMDFSCQAGAQQSCNDNTVCQHAQTPPTTHAHSPICPICARASCKYFSTPYTSRFACLPRMDYFNKSCYPDKMRLPCAKSEMFVREQRPDDTAMLNRLLDDKIERILKPVLLALAKLTPEDEISTRCASPDFPRPNTAFLESQYERERFLPRRMDPPESRSRADTSQRSSHSKYDDYDGESSSRRRSFVPNFSSTLNSVHSRTSNGVSFNEFRRKRSVDYDNDHDANFEIARDSRHMCPVEASCQRRNKDKTVDLNITESKLSYENFNPSKQDNSSMTSDDLELKKASRSFGRTF